jgi:hypothetical protein
LSGLLTSRGGGQGSGAVATVEQFLIRALRFTEYDYAVEAVPSQNLLGLRNDVLDIQTSHRRK